MTSSIIDGARVKHPRPIETVTGDLAIIHTPGIHGLADMTLVQRRLQPIYRVHGTSAAVYCPDRLTAKNPRDRSPWQPVETPAELTDHGSISGWLVVGIES